MLKGMEDGSVVVDISIDQGGCFETSRPTTWKEPTYVEEGVTHFCVTNMPGAVPQTSSQAICAAILPWVNKLASGNVARQPGAGARHQRRGRQARPSGAAGHEAVKSYAGECKADYGSGSKPCHLAGFRRIFND